MRTQIPSTQRVVGALPAAYAAELDSFLRSLEAENSQECPPEWCDLSAAP